MRAGCRNFCCGREPTLARVSRPENPSSQRGRVLLVVLFSIYLVLLAWIVLWKLEVPWVGEAALLPRPIKLVPFLPSGDEGASAPVELAINFVLFVPFGLYLGLLAPSWPWWKPASVFAGASLILETTQHLISVGSFDSTDVIVNTAGGMAGLGLVALARRRFQRRTARVMTRVYLIGTVLSLVAIAIFIASPMHYGPQRDVILRSSSQATAVLTSAVSLFSTSGVQLTSAKAVGHMSPSSSFARSSKPTVE